MGGWENGRSGGRVPGPGGLPSSRDKESSGTRKRTDLSHMQGRGAQQHAQGGGDWAASGLRQSLAP